MIRSINERQLTVLYIERKFVAQHIYASCLDLVCILLFGLVVCILLRG